MERDLAGAMPRREGRDCWGFRGDQVAGMREGCLVVGQRVWICAGRTGPHRGKLLAEKWGQKMGGGNLPNGSVARGTLEPAQLAGRVCPQRAANLTNALSTRRGQTRLGDRNPVAADVRRRIRRWAAPPPPHVSGYGGGGARSGAEGAEGFAARGSHSKSRRRFSMMTAVRVARVRASRPSRASRFQARMLAR